jgi:uncharacterized SAM-binding protein YcdF (DUF218 family)
MLRLAENAGVPRAALIPDVDGINTRASIRSTARIFRERGIEKVLVVSHWYHLPCIRMAYAQADIEVHTVPAHEEYVLLKLPYYLAREVAAWWAYRLQLM